MSRSPSESRGKSSKNVKAIGTHADRSYIFLGCSRQRDATGAARAFEIEAGNRKGQGRVGLMTPTSPFGLSPSVSPEFRPEYVAPIPDLTIGPSALEKGEYELTLHDAGAPLSPFHYHLRKVRVSPVL